MTDGTKTHPLDRIITAMLSQALGIKLDQLNKGTGAPKPAIDPAIEAQLEAMLKTTRGEQTYGEKLVGFDPEVQYPHTVSETLQDFADIIDVLVSGGHGGTNARLAIEAIQVANFWTQKALAESKL